MTELSDTGRTPGALRGAGRGGVWALVLVLAAAAGLRLATALHKSLWLDEFHSLTHARSPGLGALLDGLRQDNHPPLSFLVLRASRALFGESELALRAPSVLLGLAAVLLVWRLAGRLGGPSVRLAAALGVALSSLHLTVSTEARMYALLTLSVLGLLGGLIDLLEGRGGGVRVALWTAVGLHTHYHFLHVAVVLAGGVVLLVGRGHAGRSAGRRAGAALLAGLLLAGPWLAWGLRVQILDHGLAPGAARVTPVRLAEALVHLLFHRASLGGAALRPLFLACGVAALGLVLLAALALARSRSGDRGGAVPAVLLTAAALVVPAWAALVAWLFPRAGFHWPYLSGSIGPFALLLSTQVAALGRGAPLRRASTWGVLAAAGLLSLLHCGFAGREDYRGAVRFLAQRARPGDAVLSAEWQPDFFPHGVGLRYYLERTGGAQGLRVLDHDRHFVLDEGSLAGVGKVLVLARSLPGDVALLRQLRRRYAREEVHRISEGIFVLEFSDG